MSPEARRSTQYLMPKSRIIIIFVVFTLFVGLIGYRIISVQVVQSGEISEQAVAGRLDSNTIVAHRGDIFDSRGMRLATNQPSARVWAILDQIVDVQAVATQLSPLVERSVEDLVAAMTQPDLEWVSLARRISAKAITDIEALKIDGIVLEPEPGRYYPSGSFSAHLLGFVNNEHQGTYGVEGSYNDLLGGKPGTLVGERDGTGNVIAVSPSSWALPVDGADVVLTIDSAVQRVIEQVLVETISENRAKGGTIVVQDPATGAILGLASWPVFNPNEFDSVDDISIFNNPAISQIHEPGSTFKAIIMAIAIDDGVVAPWTVHNDAPGYIEVPDNPPITNNNGQVWGDETMTEVLEHSSNLGAIFVAEQIGRDRLYRRIAEFGIGKKTGVDLEGEERGLLTNPWEREWNDTLFYTNAFGQGVAVTPLQLVNAYSAIVNGGRLMRPYVIAEEHLPDDSVVYHEPVVARQVISAVSSATMREMLYSVVENGAGVYAKVPGYKIGAKTGTAQIPDSDGGYFEDRTMASIVGFGPVENPQFTVLVQIEEPAESPWGMTVAGPALQEILQELFLLYGIPPSEEIE